MWKKFRRNPVVKDVIYFFPLQLLILHFQRNQVLILFWILLLGYITHSLGTSYGMPFLFLFPEYMGDVNMWAYGILGFSYGGFVMAFNISSYIVNSHRFAFLATLSRPFVKYCVNNFLIPFLFTVVYVVNICWFTRYNEFLPWIKIILYLVAFFAGMAVFMSIALGYFYTVAKDFILLFGAHPDEEKYFARKAARIKRVKMSMSHDDLKKQIIRSRRREWPVETYLRNPVRIMRARGTEHYEREKLMKVFQQNHVMAAIFEVVVFATLIFLGLFREIPFFKIPAGASVFLLCTMLMMLASAVHFILRRWSTLFFILAFVLVNFLSKTPSLSVTNYAYGLDYSSPLIYNADSVQADLYRRNDFDRDRRQHEKILSRWKAKSELRSGTSRKPKLVIVNCSGGGLKSALWTFYCLQVTDSILQGRLMDNVALITGSSGGMIGASYFRELYMQQKLGIIENLYDPIWAWKVSQDMLNPVATTIALNDLFIRLQTFSEGTYTYPKDRAYAFERQLNENTDYMLDKRLIDYQLYEQTALVPMMIFSPTILNDGKRLLISPLPISFMCNNFPVNGSTNAPIMEDIEFTRVFKDQNAMNLKFTTAIRMNATFPYILPTVSLPTRPSLEIMDAGLRDNYGTRTALKYVFHLRDWINQNTSGVVIMKIHDSRKVDYRKDYTRSIADNISSPLGGLLNNLSRIHMQENDQDIQYASAFLDGGIDVVDFRLGEIITKKEISMSLHLTTREKKELRDAMEHERIRRAIQQLRRLLQ